MKTNCTQCVWNYIKLVLSMLVVNNNSHEHKLCPLLAGLFLDSYEVEFIQKFLQEKKEDDFLWPSTQH